MKFRFASFAFVCLMLLGVSTLAIAAQTDPITFDNPVNNIAFTPDGSRGYVTSEGADVYEINPGTRQITGTIEIGEATYGVVVDPTGSFLYAHTATNLLKINLTDLSVTTIFTEAVKAMEMVIPLNSGELWVLSNPGLVRDEAGAYIPIPIHVFNLADDQLVATLRSDYCYPNRIEAKPNGSQVLASYRGFTKVYDVATKNIVVEFGVGTPGTEVNAMTISPDGATYWFQGEGRGWKVLVSTSSANPMATRNYIRLMENCSNPGAEIYASADTIYDAMNTFFEDGWLDPGRIVKFCPASGTTEGIDVDGEMLAMAKNPRAGELWITRCGMSRFTDVNELSPEQIEYLSEYGGYDVPEEEAQSILDGLAELSHQIFVLDVSAEPEIVATPEALNFGEVGGGESATLSLNLANHGDAVLSVSNVTIEGEGFSVAFGAAFEIVSGGNQNVSVTFAPQASGEYAGVLNVHSDDPDDAIYTVNLTGIGLVLASPDISVDPLELNFGNVEYRRAGSLPLTITNDGNADLLISAVQLTGDCFDLDFPEAVTLAPAASLELQVSVSAITLGNLIGEILITSDDPDEAEVTVALSAVSVWVQPASLVTRQIGALNALIAAGFIDRGNGNALTSKLNNAKAQLDRGQINAAVGQIGAFINQITALVRTGRVSSANGRSLIDEANFTLDMIGHRQNSNGDPIGSSGEEIPSSFYISANYPNPFNAVTRFEFGLPEASLVTIKVIDLAGREVASLVNANLQAGTHSVVWSAESFTSGVYIVRMDAPSFSATRKVMLVK